MFGLDCENGISVKVANIDKVTVWKNSKNEFMLYAFLTGNCNAAHAVARYDNEQAAYSAKQELMTNIEYSLKGERK